MIRLEYSPDALQKIGAIHYYIATELQNLVAAADTVAALRDRIQLLKTSPKIGALLASRVDDLPAQYAGTRYLVCDKYIVIYSFDGQSARVIRIYHHAEDYVRHLF
jgi:plasmid stabilization system protein ParE